MTHTEMIVEEMIKDNGKSARFAAMISGQIFTSFLAYAQDSYCQEQFKQRPEIAKAFKEKYLKEYADGELEFERSIYGKADAEIDTGKFGGLYGHTVYKEHKDDYLQMQNEGTLQKFLARYNRLAEIRVRLYMEEMMKVATNCVPSKDSPEREHYMKKLRNVAEWSILSKECKLREVIV